MHRFAVWAPLADRVDVQLYAPSGEPTTSQPMSAQADGWWRAEVAQAGPGTDYAFTLDGGPALPDPRSRFQPHGVHGPSRLVDLAGYRWSDADWVGIDVRGRLFYELHIGTFTPSGTLAAAEERLDHLLELGVDVVELMPLAAFDGVRGWGYDGVQPYAVHAPYGGPEAFQHFVDACHARGLAVCLDVVYNHLGPSGNYITRFGPYFHDRHHTPWGEAVNLDGEGSAAVRAWIIENALGWFTDFHVDALRIDAVHALVDDSAPHLLAELSDNTAELSARLGRPLALVAESDLNDPAMVEPTADGGMGLTAQWSDDVHHALHSWCTGETQGYYTDFGDELTVARTLTRVFRHAGDWSAFRGSDWGAPVDPERHRGHAFLAYLQNHDQVGNRAVGDRMSETTAPGRVAAGAALVLTSPFTPMLFMGEEWAASTRWQFFTDFDDDLGEAVRTGRAAEFAEHGWSGEPMPDPQAAATRDASVLRWDERSHGEHAMMLGFYRDLITLRRAEPDLRDDDLTAVSVTVGHDWLVLHRGGLDVLVNLSAHATVLPTTSTAEVLLAWPGAESPEPGENGLRLAPDSVCVVRR